MRITIEIETDDLDLISLATALAKSQKKKLRVAGASPVQSDDLRLTVGKPDVPDTWNGQLVASQLRAGCLPRKPESQTSPASSGNTDG